MYNTATSCQWLLLLEIQRAGHSAGASSGAGHHDGAQGVTWYTSPVDGSVTSSLSSPARAARACSSLSKARPTPWVVVLRSFPVPRGRGPLRSPSDMGLTSSPGVKGDGKVRGPDLEDRQVTAKPTRPILDQWERTKSGFCGCIRGVCVYESHQCGKCGL